MLTVQTRNVIRQILCSEENEHKYLRGCTHECRVHPRNRYVKEQELTQEQVAEKIKALGEEYILETV